MSDRQKLNSHKKKPNGTCVPDNDARTSLRDIRAPKKLGIPTDKLQFIPDNLKEVLTDTPPLESITKGGKSGLSDHDWQARLKLFRQGCEVTFEKLTPYVNGEQISTALLSHTEFRNKEGQLIATGLGNLITKYSQALFLLKQGNSGGQPISPRDTLRLIAAGFEWKSAPPLPSGNSKVHIHSNCLSNYPSSHPKIKIEDARAVIEEIAQCLVGRPDTDLLRNLGDIVVASPDEKVSFTLDELTELVETHGLDLTEKTSWPVVIPVDLSDLGKEEMDWVSEATPKVICSIPSYTPRISLSTSEAYQQAFTEGGGDADLAQALLDEYVCEAKSIVEIYYSIGVEILASSNLPLPIPYKKAQEAGSDFKYLSKSGDLCFCGLATFFENFEDYCHCAQEEINKLSGYLELPSQFVNKYFTPEDLYRETMRRYFRQALDAEESRAVRFVCKELERWENYIARGSVPIIMNEVRAVIQSNGESFAKDLSRLLLVSSDGQKQVSGQQILDLNEDRIEETVLELKTKGKVSPDAKADTIRVNLSDKPYVMKSGAYVIHSGSKTPPLPPEIVQVMYRSLFDKTEREIAKVVTSYLGKYPFVDTGSFEGQLIIANEKGEILFNGLLEYLEFVVEYYRTVDEETRKLSMYLGKPEDGSFYFRIDSPLKALDHILECRGDRIYGGRHDELAKEHLTRKMPYRHTWLLNGRLQPEDISSELARCVLKHIESEKIDVATVLCDSDESFFINVIELQLIAAGNSPGSSLPRTRLPLINDRGPANPNEKGFYTVLAQELLIRRLLNQTQIEKALADIDNTRLPEEEKLKKKKQLYNRCFRRAKNLVSLYEAAGEEFIQELGAPVTHLDDNLDFRMLSHDGTVVFENFTSFCHSFSQAIAQNQLILDCVAAMIGIPAKKLNHWPLSLVRAVNYFNSSLPGAHILNIRKNCDVEISSWDSAEPIDSLAAVEILHLGCLQYFNPLELESLDELVVLRFDIAGRDPMYGHELIASSGLENLELLEILRAKREHFLTDIYKSYERDRKPDEEFVTLDLSKVIYAAIPGVHERSRDIARSNGIFPAGFFPHTLSAVYSDEAEFERLHSELTEIDAAFHNTARQYWKILAPKEEGNKRITSIQPNLCAFPEVRICSEEGRVIFENWGHFVSCYYNYIKHCRLVLGALREHSSVRKSTYYDDPQSIFEAHLSLLESLNVKFTGEDRAYKLGIDHQLSVLPPKRENITQECAKAALKEAATYLVGRSTEYGIALLGEYTFGDTALNYSITSQELRDLAIGESIEQERMSLRDSLVQMSHRLGLSSETIYLALISLGIWDLDDKDTHNFKDYYDGFAQREEQLEDSLLSNVVVALTDLVYQSGHKRRDENSAQAVSDLLKILSLKLSDGDPERAILRLKELSRSVLQDVIRESLEITIESLRQIADFNHPSSLNFTLVPLQTDAVIAALDGSKPMIVGGPATGKTEMGIAISEVGGFDRVLWATKIANITGTANRIRASYKEDPGVLELNKTHWKIDPTTFKIELEGKRYVVCSGRTLHTLEKRSPENFLLLKAWLESGRNTLRLPDEVHLLDNERSLSSQAFSKFAANKNVAMSGTPVQHKLSKLPAILKLCFTDGQGPTQPELERASKDVLFGIYLMRKYSTIFNVEDIARYFEEPGIVPYLEQLKDGPRIPRIIHRTENIRLSLAQSLVHLDIQHKFAAWCEAHGLPNDPLKKTWAYKKLRSFPEKLGILGEENPLIESVIAKCNSLKAQGKKILVYAESVHLIHSLFEDPRMQNLGCCLLDGSVDAPRREQYFKELETSNTLWIGLAQSQASGSGFNSKNIGAILILEEPQTISDEIQIIGRGPQPIFYGQEQSARTEIEVIKFVLTHSDTVSNHFKAQGIHDFSPGLTVFEAWDRRRNSDVTKYRSVTTRVNMTENTGDTELVDVIREIEKATAEASQKLAELEVISLEYVRSKARINRHEAKDNWRENFVYPNLDDFLKRHQLEPFDANSVIMAGADALEVPYLIGLGIGAHSIHAVDNTRDEALAEQIDSSVRHSGNARFYNANIETVLRALPSTSFISLDPYGPMTLSLMRSLQFARFDKLAISINIRSGREDGATSAILNRLRAIRERNGSTPFRGLELERIALYSLALKLTGTRAHLDYLKFIGENLADSISEILGASNYLAWTLFQVLPEHPQEELTDFITEVFLKAPHVSDIKTHRYRSQSGNAHYNSVFADVTQWDPNAFESSTSQSIGSLMVDILDGAKYSKISRKGNNIIIEAEDNRTFVLQAQELLDIFSYWSERVDKIFRLSTFNISSWCPPTTEILSGERLLQGFNHLGDSSAYLG